ncbi:hypothetical protein SAMN04488045_3675 [Thalassococcus halodurans]|jgi:hypothetical protein|uniref:Uncharacterized protein n=1 Tax=Thalassococcus halodurans TaxID=373675 RepID=A0A1H6BP63_9RHOB|nr:hypothetical protein SAMN04488045_3675 [Thalassococcus halodurans]
MPNCIPDIQFRRFLALVVFAIIGLTGRISIFAGLILSGVACSSHDQKGLVFYSFKRVPRAAGHKTTLETVRGNF